MSLQPVQVATGSRDTEGLLVFAGDYLVAVLVQLSNAQYAKTGMWFLEAAFGPVNHPAPPTFADLMRRKPGSGSG